MLSSSRFRPVLQAPMLALLVGNLPSLGALAADGVGDYRPSSGLAVDRETGAPLAVLRAFERGRQQMLLVVVPPTLETRVVPALSLEVEPRPWREVRARLAQTAYGRALSEAEQLDHRLIDAGLTHVSGGSPGIDLTIDLCPSRRPLDRALFTTVIEELGQIEKPVPIAVALTGVWMKQHPADLDWLLSLVRTGALSVTWINHSFTHRTAPDRPLRQNFLLEPGTDVEREVLATERAMIERGLVPSVLFRFPGLVSSPAVFLRVVELGLIPVGSDAWLAKNEWPRQGSIVLVHANGNEPLGVRRFLELLRKNRQDIRQRRWLLLDLRESLAAEGSARKSPP